MDFGFILSWQNVTVTTVSNKKNFFKQSQEEKIILNGVSGKAKSGSLVAIIGPSGAGKTTLLTTLAGKISSETGRLLINNKFVTKEEMKSISGYLHQHFVAVESLTLREHLIFMKALKLKNINWQNRELIMDNLISELNLQSCINTPIRNLSGGEKKKLALAVELLNDPAILYCDEPTTGLDSFSANSVIEVLHRKAFHGKLVMVAIHQPSLQLYNNFHEIILVDKGAILYQGSRSEIDNFFASANLNNSLTGWNPADFYIQQITDTNRNLEVWRQLDVNRETSEQGRLDSDNLVSNLHHRLRITKFQKRNIFVQLCWLNWRSYIKTKRSIGHVGVNFGLSLLCAFIITFLYSDVKEDENNVQNIKGVLFLITSELIFSHLYAVLYTFPEEHIIFMHEESFYSPYAYFLSKIVALIPKCIVQPFLFLLMIFLRVHFSSGFPLFVKTLFVTFIGCITATVLGLCISSVFQSLAVIELFIMPLDLLAMLVAGIFLNTETVPFYFQWAKYSSPFYYVYESLSILQWNDVAEIACSNRTTLPCYKSGKEVLESLGFHTDTFRVLLNLASMCGLSVCFGLIGYLGILKKQRCLR